MGVSNSKAAAGRGGSRTTSHIISETKTGSLTMHIAGYSQTKGIGVGQSIKSSTFDAGGHSWYIKYYPNGEQQETVGWTSVFLYLHTPAAITDIVRASFQFSLLEGDGRHQHVFSRSRPYECIFSMVDGYSRTWGLSKFFWRKDLKRYLAGRDFHMRCDVAVLRTASASPAPVVPPLPTSELHHDLGGILATGDGADMCFMVAGEPLLAHRSVLAARSSVLKDVLLGPGMETAGTCMEVDDMDAGVFRAMLHFIYTDALPHIEEGNQAPMAQGLLVAANRFNIERLKLMSEDMLCKCINSETVASTLTLAEKYGCQGLKRACLMFIKSAPLSLLQADHRSS